MDKIILEAIKEVGGMEIAELVHTEKDYEIFKSNTYQIITLLEKVRELSEKQKAKEIFAELDKLNIVEINGEGTINDVKFLKEIDQRMLFEATSKLKGWNVGGYFIYYRDYLALKSKYDIK